MKTSTYSSLASLPIVLCAPLWPLHSPPSCYRMETQQVPCCTLPRSKTFTLIWQRHGSRPCCINSRCLFRSKVPSARSYATPSKILRGPCTRMSRNLLTSSYHLHDCLPWCILGIWYSWSGEDHLEAQGVCALHLCWHVLAPIIPSLLPPQPVSAG